MSSYTVGTYVRHEDEHRVTIDMTDDARYSLSSRYDVHTLHVTHTNTFNFIVYLM